MISEQEFSLPQGFSPVAIPVPPAFEEGINYPPKAFVHPGEDTARYVAFHWQGGKNVAFADGHLSAVGLLDDEAFFAFVMHPAIHPALAPLDQLGTSLLPATHWLVLDRQTRQWYLAPVEVASAFLAQQWGFPEQQESPVIQEHPLDDEDFQGDLFDLKSWIQVTSSIGQVADALQAFQERQQKTEKLVAWLDAWQTHRIKQMS